MINKLEQFAEKTMYNPFYRVWANIKNRCFNSNLPNFINYGGRGITLCQRWNSFEEFRDDMYFSYQEHCQKFGEKNTTIDRIDNNGNYCKENCRWATWKEQINNRRPRRNSIFLTFNKETRIPIEWSKKLGISIFAIRSRIKRKWSVEKILSTPCRSYVFRKII